MLIFANGVRLTVPSIRTQTVSLPVNWQSSTKSRLTTIVEQPESLKTETLLLFTIPSETGMLPCRATLHASAITGMVHPHFSSTYSASNALHACVDTSVHSIHFSFLCSLHTIFCSVGFSPPAGFCHGL